MSRLNDTIKFGVLVVNSALLLVSLVAILTGALVLTGNWADFDPETFEATALWACVIGSVLLILTLVGCFGAITQTEREGICSGRRLLSAYQIFLIVLLILFIRLGIEGKTTIDSMEWTLDNRGQGEYDKGDMLLADKINNNYFSNLCLPDPSSAWLIDFVDKSCPSSMQVSRGGKCACDTTKADCPDEDGCETAMARWKEDKVYDKDALALCPYHVCRYQVLAEVIDTVDPILDIIAVAIYIIGAMIFLTCLLICYNPHDDTAAQLIKTGVLVEKRVPKSSPRKQQQQRRQTRGGSASSRQGPTGPARGHRGSNAVRKPPPRGHRSSNASHGSNGPPGHNRL
ncbi:hypothetical protein TrCOL_g1825 [Triparma columacea]|uniref:Tetraspanin n=1 Tax=Triparma columacea TaxID=722753 RepID=A0A9W7G892_9STRA|nr:hypothetical protein TrCOL_g1825 [Triparma columacea]